MRDMRLHALSILFCCPIISIEELSRQLSVAYNTAHRILRTFMKYGFLVKETQQKRHKLFRFKAYLDVLERTYDPCKSVSEPFCFKGSDDLIFNSFEIKMS